MNAANMANTYKHQQIMTASPEELTLMLYNGALRFIAESMQAIDHGNMEKSHNSNLRAQAIMREFMATLDMQYEISQGYNKLYDYIEYRLIQANLKKDKSQLEEAKNMLQELRDAWVQAMKSTKTQRAVAR
ncbi:flagellar export chaperone FliS [Sporomusa sp.]|jgi:flagellar protein FliS|uniref:flagellar export chaperone FliS n=1 Tax=Sporomusa sp. TaxID=2078658 RepID=UPI002979C07A|nr:flagellar export chaperone FliS [Sporomusa sp.]MDF2572571.1 fliS [Sporomusa sp.]HWR06984.1 flagellar export chaperone FliS [Sporomusa sp.]